MPTSIFIIQEKKLAVKSTLKQPINASTRTGPPHRNLRESFAVLVSRTARERNAEHGGDNDPLLTSPCSQAQVKK
jgi:hypothetical protein